MAVYLAEEMPACYRGVQPFKQVEHTERYNVLQGPDHSNITAVTNVKLNITIKLA
jgi:hypothetical protein